MQHFQASLETEARISFQASHLDANAAVLQNASQRADSIAWASYFAELISKLFGEGEAHPLAFKTLLATLSGLAEGALGEGVLRCLELRLLSEAGLRPQLGACASCQTPTTAGRRLYGIPRVGGVLCEACVDGERSLPMAVGTCRLLERGLDFPLEALPRLTFSPGATLEARAFTLAFSRYHVGEPGKAARFLASFLFEGLATPRR